MKATLSRSHSHSHSRGSILAALILTVVSVSMIGLLAGFGLAFMGGVVKHKNAAAEAAEAAAAAETAAAAAAPAPAPAAPEVAVVEAAPAPATPAPEPKVAATKPAAARKAADAPDTVAAGDAKEIEIGTHAMQFLFLVTEFTVKSGEKVKINFKNTSTQVPQPHNIVICKPGKKGAVEALAMQLMTDPNAMQKGYIPETEDIFAHSKLLQPGQSEILEFTAPEPGTYDYLCTFPGHWILMKGVMTVE